ncbi:MAG: glutamine--fructose-6-phosphate transaminase (isomerizing) [Solirubrobacterales bacterium]|nr:glutamine--fructose-6-phosphate transaminase (isomerizing) [Solirubrobacterales bacterium]
MCGIIGYVGHRRSQDVLFDGLRRLEYRGYDSAGLAWRENGRTECVRAIGNLDSLGSVLAAHSAATDASESAAVATATVSAGIAHTRWATHGGVTEDNAHPHTDWSGRVRIVLNGIIENYLELRDLLADEMIQCTSETDAEVVAQLISFYYDGDLSEAVRSTVSVLSGHFAFVAMCDDDPETLVGVRRECPLVVGVGDRELFIASSISAFVEHTPRVVELHDGEIAVMHPSGLTVFDDNGLPRDPQETRVERDEDRCEKEGFETFMLKEIHEQPSAIAETLRETRAALAPRENHQLGLAQLRNVRRIIIVGCGTSYHAALAGRMAIERWARVPVEVDVASEFRYRDPIIEPGTLVLGITQSGETADTLAAMRLARARGATVVALTNAPGSQATREADAVLFTRAGLEIGVAATKTFVAQVVLLYALALDLARAQDALALDRLAELQRDLDLLPAHVEHVTRSVDGQMRQLAERLVWSPFFLYLGRLSGLSVALEGALKLKEISYVPTDAYAAGEMKHGPIALLGRDTPVVCVATEEGVLPKLLSNLSEVRARGAQVLAVASEGCKQIAEHAEHVVYVPAADSLLQVVVAIVPLQLFAYHLARARGLNVDQPRNLAKTVTVE